LGQTATFSVTATGTATLAYQWQQNAVNIAGATAAAYTTPATNAADNGATFTVVVSNAVGSATSNPAALTVNASAPPALTQQPANQSVALGQQATFSVAATGAGTLTYQWQQNAVNIAGATAASYTTPPTTAADSGASFGVVVTDQAGSLTSNSATLTVNVPAQPSYYVATNGNDTADGSAGSPFATLGRAQLAMQQSSIKMTQIYAGTYYLTSPLTLTALDQGETWQAMPGAAVILSGGQRLTGWVSEGNGIYSTTAPGSVGLDLAINGVRQLPATLGYDPQRPFITGWRELNPNQPSNFGVTFTVPASDMTASVKPGAILQVLDFLRYTDQFTTITAVDPSTNTITVRDQFNTGTTTPGISGSWRVLNDPADLSAPGQFAYDATTGKAYVEPVSEDTLATDTVVAAQLSTLLALNNVSGVTISGLTFSDTTSDRWIYSGMFNDRLAAVMATSVSNSSFTGNTFVNVGNGIALSGSSNNVISGNAFSQLGGSGIFLTGNSNKNQVTSNTLTGLGKISVGSTGIHLENSANNLVDSNTVDGSPRWGIDLYPTDSVSLVGNTVSNNILRNTSQQTNDTGAIYSYAGDSPGYVKENTVITGNRIENVGGLLRNGSGNYVAGASQGIYMDDQVSAITIDSNVVESIGSGMMLCHGCQTNVATNNVVVLQPAAFYDRGANGISFSTGAMNFNGTTRVDLLPSYFPAALPTSTIVVQLSGHAAGGASAAFSVQADGTVIGTGTASGAVADYIFTAQLTPHMVHRIGITLTNGATTGTSTATLSNMALFVNNTAVQLVAPEATGNYGSYGFVAGGDRMQVTNFSATHNIVYRNGGGSMDVLDWSDGAVPAYIDPNPGSIGDNVLFQNVAKSDDTTMGSNGTDANSQLVNPMFANAVIGDYALQANSPALGLGFSTSATPLAQ
jgi:parallel beta-helix repeat protein